MSFLRTVVDSVADTVCAAERRDIGRNAYLSTIASGRLRHRPEVLSSGADLMP
jgi:hypothetical protein